VAADWHKLIDTTAHYTVIHCLRWC